jgi:hypothetical protein
MATTPKEKIQTVLRIRPHVRSTFKAMATDDGRTMSGLFEYLVTQEANRRRGRRSSS